LAAVLQLADAPQPDPSGRPRRRHYITYCLSTTCRMSRLSSEGKRNSRHRRGLRHLSSEGDRGSSHLPGRIDRRRRTLGGRDMKEKLGINVFGFSCEGYKGVSQSAGHQIATISFSSTWWEPTKRRGREKFKINMLGEYNIGGDAFVIEDCWSGAASRWCPPSAATPPTMPSQLAHGRSQRVMCTGRSTTVAK